MLRTEDGSLSSIQEMLQRIRELTVQGKNGTYNSEQKSSIEIEMAEIIDRINRVAKNVNFNGMGYHY